MPPRYAYWTILIDNKPTAFRSRDEEELLPTLNQLRRKNSDVVMKWFARGRLWDTPEQARWAGKNLEGSAERRGKDWRPGGEHKDPRARFEKRKTERPSGAAQPVRPTDKKAFRPADSQRRSADSQRQDRPHRKPPSGAARSGPPWSGKPPSDAGEGGRPRRDPWRSHPPRGPAKGGRSWPRDGQGPGAAKGGRPGREPRPGDNPAPGASQGRPGPGAPPSGGPTTRAEPFSGRPPGTGDTPSPDGIAHRPDTQESATLQKGKKPQIEPA